MGAGTVRALLAGSILLLALGGCLPGIGGPPGPVVAPTGEIFEPGIPPSQTRFSQTATILLQQNRAERALELAMEGIEDDPENPVHFFLAGVAHTRLGEWEEADRMFDEAERIHPPYALEVEPERESAWARAFNEGADAYSEDDLAGAIAAWEGATVIFDLRPEAHQNLAMLLQLEGRFEEAVAAYRGALEGLERRPVTRVLEAEEERRREELRWEVEAELARALLVVGDHQGAEPLLRRQLERTPGDIQARGDLATALSGQGRQEEAVAIYSDLLTEEDLEATQLFNLGIAFFRNDDFGRAGEAFSRVSELRPNSRDAWFNYANALFAERNWERLTRVGDRLLELDPLSENAALITARAYLEGGDEETALRILERIDGLPAYVEGLLMAPGEGGVVVRGRVTANGQAPGEEGEVTDSVRLRFSFYGETGPLGTEEVTVQIPPTGESRTFEITFPGNPVGYRYELVR